MAAPAWMRRLLRLPTANLETVPLGAPGTLAWHASVGEVRRSMRSLGALSLEHNGWPTVRLKWGDLTLRAETEFTAGVHVGEACWLPDHPSADFYTREGFRVRMEPRLRAVTARFPLRDPRGNWKHALDLLGKPHGKDAGGDWKWEWKAMRARYLEAPVRDDPEATESLRFESTSTSRVLEIRNQSPLELYEKVRVRVDFQAGTWKMGDRPAVVGTPLRLLLDTPVEQPLLVTVTAAEREIPLEVGPRCTKVVLTSDGQGGVRVVA